MHDPLRQWQVSNCSCRSESSAAISDALILLSGDPLAVSGQCCCALVILTCPWQHHGDSMQLVWQKFPGHTRPHLLVYKQCESNFAKLLLHPVWPSKTWKKKESLRSGIVLAVSDDPSIKNARIELGPKLWNGTKYLPYNYSETKLEGKALILFQPSLPVCGTLKAPNWSSLGFIVIRV